MTGPLGTEALSAALREGLVALLAPAAAALVLAVLPALRRRGGAAALVCIAGTAVSLVVAGMRLAEQAGRPGIVREALWTWLPVAGGPLARVGVRLDGVSVSMLCVVTFVAFCVQVFSVGYMAGEPPAARGRYFAFHALFLFSMNLLVLAPNLLQAFLGWELVGTTSYLLIGFYYRKPSAAKAAVKAFWVTKFADMGFVVALVVLYGATGDFGWTAALPAGTATAVTALLFAAVVGKSAQFPLHVWLPDAMEGPTPVSALLHAATMVAAGVFLVTRADPLFVQAPDVRAAMAMGGAATALFAASIAAVQTDVKRVLAYSTCSQLGYMVCALGAGSAVAGFFHLTTHAFFKALLFLGAGSVIHAVHSNEMGEMGGLARRMPLTAATFAAGALSLVGIPGLAGFFSKDLVLGAVEGRLGWAPYAALMATVALTAYYMGRVLCLVFLGPASEKAAHARESGPAMALPLVLLAIPSIGAGWLAAGFARLLGAEVHLHFGATPAAASALGLAGLGVAWAIHGRRVPAGLLGAAFAPVGRIARSAAVDRAYEAGYRRLLLAGSRGAGWLDRYVVDGLMNVAGASVLRGGRAIRRIQTGYVHDAVYAVVAGVVVLAAWGVFR